MISTFTSARATRWAGGVLVVAASALGLGVVGPIATASAVAAAPTVVTISPSSETIASGGCAALTAHATTPSSTAPGAPATGEPVTVQATETVAGGSSTPLSTCTPAGGGSTPAGVSNSVVGGSAAGLGGLIPAKDGTATLRFNATTDANGDILVGVSSTLVGSLSVLAYYNNGANAAPASGNPTSSAATVTVIAGGAAAVGTLTVTPTAATQYVGSGVTYTVTTTDTSGVPIPGIEVDYVTSGPDTQVPVHQCGVLTDSNGEATCTITNGGTAGTDTTTFYVNATGGTPGPDTGEPQATATAVFQALPANGNFTVHVACSNTYQETLPEGLACANSTATHTVTFTATVLDGSSQPVSGAAVDWSRIQAGGPAPDTTLSATSCTTSAAGTCTVTLTEPDPLNDEEQQLTGTVGPDSGHATAGWFTPTASSFTVTPPLQTVTLTGSPAFTGTVTDQFGAGVSGQTVTYLVAAGRDAGKSGSGTTGANGTVSLGYLDTGLNAGSQTDTVQFHDTTAGGPTNTVTDTVNYISGSTQAGVVTLDVSGSCNTTAPSSTNSNSVGAGTVKVCALVTNASGTKLLGKPVTFAVSIGKVDSTTPQSAGAGPSVTVDTDANGVATAYVSSATAGTQTVTAQSDAISATGTVSYTTSVANLHTVTITPATTSFAPGSSQTFTATALDSGGNPVAGASLLFVTSGPGTIAGGSNELLSTAANGTASVVLATTASDSGTGTVTVSVQNDTATQCQATGGTCTAVGTYTVKVGAGAASLLLFPEKGVTAGSGSAEGVEAVALNADGTVAPNQVIRFTVTGANTGSGAVTTTSSGAAIFAYDAVNAGTDTVSAYDDLNDNGTADPGEPTSTVTATIYPAGSTPGGGATKTEHPKLTVTQAHASSGQEKLTLDVTSSPKLVNAKVTFYQVKKGVRHKIGSGTTGAKGKVKGTLKAAHGLTLKFQAKVGKKAGVKAGYTKVVTVHVK